MKDKKVETILMNIFSQGIVWARKNSKIYIINILLGIFNMSEYKDKFNGNKFHDKCDKKYPILIIIVMKSGLIIGGY